LWPSYTWDERVRQYRDAHSGRLVSRTAVRQALDEAIDAAREGLVDETKRLQAGAINLPEWQIRMERLTKSIHVMSAAVAAGGWAQATPADYSIAANRIKAAYLGLERLARKLESGEIDVADGRLANWARGYGAAGSGTYEIVLRRRDLATGRVIAERRLLHSAQPCTPCIGYHALGWQPPRVLPDIGAECLCKKHCRCTFQRQFVGTSTLKFILSDAARLHGDVTVLVDVAMVMRSLARDAAFFAGAGGKGREPAKIAGVRTFLTSGKPIEMPRMALGVDGDAHALNGRHRFAVLAEAGVKVLPVSVPKDAAAEFRRRFGKGANGGQARPRRRPPTSPRPPELRP
jgi:hypothetical protein